MHPTPADGQALALPYQNLRHAMLAYLRKQVTDAAVAEDLLHEVFLKALAATQRKGTPHNLPGWLYTIARNTVIDYYRAKRPMDALPDDLLASDPPDNVASQALANCLKPLAEQLAPLYRDTLLATEFQGKTLQTVATEENVSLSAVKSRASRGRKLLKESLLACCQVEVSGSGEVLDFQPRHATPVCAAPGSCA
ncbi:MAG: sigma-70 family RNA polymerase sigma factor [Rhodoferax sp.]|nr:sigma-70 family RNA polymerase sigma factor [Rhodoferax sp.]MDP3654562.1 sigma-70 family RNA polymerase sigma factor [Rhodoferax sp.]